MQTRIYQAFTLALLMLLTAGWAAAQGEAAPRDEMTSRAEALVGDLVNGQIQEKSATYTPWFADGFFKTQSFAKLDEQWKAVQVKAGKLLRTEPTMSMKKDKFQGRGIVRFYEQTLVSFAVVFDSQQKIASFIIMPVAMPPGANSTLTRSVGSKSDFNTPKSVPVPDQASKVTTAPAPANDLDRLALDAIQLLVSGKIQDLEKNFDATMQQALPAEKMTAFGQQLLMQAGLFQKIEKIQPMSIRLVTCTFEKGKLAVNIVFNSDHKISGLMLLPAQAAPPGPAPSDELSKQAGQVIDTLMIKKDTNAVFQQFDPAMRKEISAEKLAQVQSQAAAKLGVFKSTDSIVIMDIRLVSCKFEKGMMDANVIINGQKKIVGLTITPAQPPAANPAQGAPSGKSLYTEQDVIVGSGDWALRGTLTLPANGPGPFPAVVLVHGSGPQDRDETIGPNKPFRDLAWGLAGRGVAVLRYEKRTKAYLMKCAASEKPLTAKEETVDDALAAVALLHTRSEIDGKRIVVAGHSLGGMLAPRIAQQDPSIAGLIILAGTTRPLEDVILEQVTYLASLDTVSPKSTGYARIEKIKRQVNAIKELKPGKPSSDILILGVSPQYWLDLQDYHPAETARTLTQPMFIIQGGRDYQVTMDDFKGWQNALLTRANVTFKVYPSLNHLFIKGEGKSTPGEYDSVGYVSTEVVNDIAEWMKKL